MGNKTKALFGAKETRVRKVASVMENFRSYRVRAEKKRRKKPHNDFSVADTKKKMKKELKNILKRFPKVREDTQPSCIKEQLGKKTEAKRNYETT